MHSSLSHPLKAVLALSLITALPGCASRPAPTTAPVATAPTPAPAPPPAPKPVKMSAAETLRASRQQELARLQAQQDFLFRSSQNYDGMARNDRAMGYDDSSSKRYADIQFAKAQAFNARIEELQRLLR